MRHFLRPFILILMVWAVVTSCQSNLPSQVVAEVDGDPITAAEFTEELSPLVEGYHIPLSLQEQEALERLKEALLGQIIEKRLIIHEARKMGITVNDEELEEAFTTIKGGYPEGGFEEVVKKGGIPLPQWKERLRQRLLIEKVINRVSQVTSPIDEPTLREYYEEHRVEFVVPEQVRVRQIVVRNIKDAKIVLRRLKRGKPFEELARRYSSGPEAEEGGDLGFFGRGEMPEELDVVFSLKVGEISSIVQSPYGYHIFQLVAKQEQAKLGFEEVKEEVRERILREREEGAFQDWLAGVKEKARIRINQKALEEIRPPTPKRGGE
ncbi:MAG: peptidylprolyl isomerase [Deltaproteobacteria bacterium]|nr:peptidylprolyl isomerase [Deltaproteobacteria bacterium]